MESEFTLYLKVPQGSIVSLRMQIRSPDELWLRNLNKMHSVSWSWSALIFPVHLSYPSSVAVLTQCLVMRSQKAICSEQCHPGYQAGPSVRFCLQLEAWTGTYCFEVCALNRCPYIPTHSLNEKSGYSTNLSIISSIIPRSPWRSGAPYFSFSCLTLTSSGFHFVP